MNADDINGTIDNLEDIAEDVAEKYLLNIALMAVLGTTTGPFAFILRPLIIKILELTAFKFLKYVKRKAQKRIDIIEGKMIIRDVNKAVEDGDENDYIIAIGKY
ncbi:MAG: hypothetical protein KAG61_11030 [Bacteriovoracaceae bacterium]|nr:hypothetical protein [Bacteriovoracaceae bacterium]